MSSEGTFVYHPLGPDTPLFALWQEAIGQRRREDATVPPDVMRRYRSHLSAQLRNAKHAPLPDRLEDDQRELVRQFRAFFPMFLKRIGAPDRVAQIPVSFPKLDFFDARATEADNKRAIFVSSRALDLIELFARTMSLCARLNGLAIPILCQAQQPPPKFLVLAWMPLLTESLPGFSLDSLRKLPAGPQAEGPLRKELFGAFQGDLRQAMGRWRLTHYLAGAMLLAMGRMLRGDGREEQLLFKTASALQPCDAAGSIDSRYLATLVLTFIALHEHAHLAHRHQSLEPMEVDPQIKQMVEGLEAYAREHPDRVVETVDLTASTQRFEQDADCFPFEVTPEEYHHALLEAATLWLGVLASADRGGMDWLEKAGQSKGRAYPQYAMRVWFLNGRFSTGERQGEIARCITRAVEAIEARPSEAEFPAQALQSSFAALWKIARAEAELPVG